MTLQHWTLLGKVTRKVSVLCLQGQHTPVMSSSDLSQFHSGEVGREAHCL